MDGEEAHEELDEDDDLEIPDAVDEELAAQPPALDEPPALEYCPDIRKPVDHNVEPSLLQPTQPPNIFVADPIGVAEQSQVPVIESIP